MIVAELPIDRYDTLRSVRVKLGMSQQEAAEQIGIAEGTLRSWERDSSKIGFDYIQKIERVYGVEHRFIFFGKESTFSELMRKKNTA
ncbi:helix-turn-helix transcriptional regulator [Cohnella lubricantis]|uniref:Helix-turn-helix transcriptional regulator n=1 Tax=Cohnella lubricantis TaxID=2163172 RepID=A0A841TE31_9BACL|nr:helix-turn-helix transcriptional regulator [Cohnella lubricantis]MBB6677490.1 helix-turn-helix transcriptional regulator [Cohnella lubricantis]MBP2116624.1 transcriptional regulator with XRE-family HTH domain [Cohnella lubricantis]